MRAWTAGDMLLHEMARADAALRAAADHVGVTGLPRTWDALVEAYDSGAIDKTLLARITLVQSKRPMTRAELDAGTRRGAFGSFAAFREQIQPGLESREVEVDGKTAWRGGWTLDPARYAFTWREESIAAWMAEAMGEA